MGKSGSFANLKTERCGEVTLLGLGLDAARRGAVSNLYPTASPLRLSRLSRAVLVQRAARRNSCLAVAGGAGECSPSFSSTSWAQGWVGRGRNRRGRRRRSSVSWRSWMQVRVSEVSFLVGVRLVSTRLMQFMAVSVVFRTLKSSWILAELAVGPWFPKTRLLCGLVSHCVQFFCLSWIELWQTIGLCCCVHGFGRCNLHSHGLGFLWFCVSLFACPESNCDKQ
jgi:hypothetical protein